MCLLSLSLLILSVTYYAQLVQGRGRICPIRECDGRLDPSLQFAPGVGFHLGLTSGSVAISYDDGHVENIVNIPGSTDYIALMRDLTCHPDRLDPPPLNTITQRLEYARKEFRRRANLLLGRPGTPNASTLSSMLASLRSEAESQVSRFNTTIGIAFPNSALVSGEEINDALAYTGLKELDQWQVPDRELNAAYGAFGFGLCSSYTDPYKCEEEEAAFGDGNMVLHLDYTKNTLAANTHQISTAQSTYATMNFVDWGLGRDEIIQGRENSEYWDAVKLRIQELVTVAQQPYSQLLLTGDRAKDETFLRVVRDALRGSKLTSTIEISKNQIDLTYVVARGTAEFQRRRQRGWLGCTQPMHDSETSIWERTISRAQQVLEL